MVSNIKKQHGKLGFECDLNARDDRSKDINSNIPRPQKRLRLLNDDENANKNIQPRKPQPPTSRPTSSKNKSKTKSNSKQLLAQNWRWSPPRRTIAVEQAVKYRLFDIKLIDGKRDQKIAFIVTEMNGMTDVDINFVLLTTESYTKEIYKIQRKVLKVKEDAL